MDIRSAKVKKDLIAVCVSERMQISSSVPPLTPSQEFKGRGIEVAFINLKSVCVQRSLKWLTKLIDPYRLCMFSSKCILSV
jgi:hypothetical protein